MKTKTPDWIKIFWFVPMPGLILFLVQMVYECVYLTLKSGPQMIFLSLKENHFNLYMFMIISFCTSLVWIMVYSIWLIFCSLQKTKTDALWQFVSTIIIVLLIYFLSLISG